MIHQIKNVLKVTGSDVNMHVSMPHDIHYVHTNSIIPFLLALHSVLYIFT